MPRRDTDRNLLFGILALQMDFLTRDALIAAMNAWVLEKHRPIGEILVERGALDPSDRALLDPMVDRHVARHGGDAIHNLAAISHLGGMAADLRREVSDPDVQESLAFVPPSWANQDSFATRAPETADFIPAAIRYRKVRDHAEGGLGIVYVARDEELNREVALKEIKPKYADHSESQARFLVEAEITGGLEHPGIVPVYGLGHYDDGRPYYAMRFIRGDSLKDAIASFHKDENLKKDPGARTLALQKLLRRFLDVCNAVAYAHSRGVLHRDIKPANVMVGRYGETLVVDWGLAKAVGRSQEDGYGPLPESTLMYKSSSNAAETLPGTPIGTPAYMSPEQAAGRLDLLGPASDVYSLGATLYSLLTGTVPIAGKDLSEIYRKVQRGEFPRPRETSPWLDPALEAICLKAMGLKPEARYASPRALAEDVERWLADEPVSAYPEPFLRRAGRWARRHRTALATGTTAAMVAALLLGVFSWQRFAQRQRIDASAVVMLDQSERFAIEARTGGKPTEWIRAVAEARRAVDQLDSGGGSTMLRSEAKTRLEALQAEESAIAALEGARLLGANVKEGGFDTGAELDAYLAAFRAYGIDVAALPVDDAAMRIRSSRIADHLISALDDWARYQTVDVPDSRLEAIARAADSDPEKAAIRDMVARRDAAGLRRLCEKEEGRRKLGPRLRFVFDSLLRLDPAGSFPLLDVILRENRSDFWLNHDLGVAYYNAKPPQAQEVVRLLSVAVALRPESPAAHHNLGLALVAQGKTDQAIDEYHEAIRLKPDYAKTHLNLGATLTAQGKLDQAIDAYRQAIRVKADLAEAHCNLGLVLNRQGLFRESLESLERGHELGSKQPGWKHPSESWVLNGRGLANSEASLPSILKGEARPANEGERLVLAEVCYKKGLYWASARFWGEAFAERPVLADDPSKNYRYNAACAAALAGLGSGQDDPMPDESARRGLREKACGWLRADLTALAKLSEGGDEPAPKKLATTLAHWKADTDLAGIRDEAALAKLPEAEWEAFRSLWADVEALWKKAEGLGGR